MSGFNDKAVLVTGGGSGIGRATALAFAAAGARLLIADIGLEAGQCTVDGIVGQGGTARFQECDVADQASVEAMVAAAVGAYGRLDCAINCAGIDPEITLEPRWDISEFDRIVAINLRGVMLCLHAELAAMRETGGGAIVNFASYAGVVGVPSKPFYTAAKHGVVGLTKAAGVEQAKYGIRINAICPGFTKTPMALANTDEIPGGLDAVVARNPTRRVAEASEMAAAAMFLCSDEAGFIIGQSLSIDGGNSVQ
jgi:NAD(P)-dependent dehydrogenase (short-subunit alcohol dehydrogenase family)